MPFAGMPPDCLRFLAELKENNDRAWFEAHRERYEQSVKQPFGELLTAVSAGLASHTLPLSGGPKTMFRIYRDTRFSTNKTPYKTNVSGVLTPSGAKGQPSGVVYLHLEPADAFFAAGFWQPQPAELLAFRTMLIEQPDEFQAMVKQLKKKGLELSREDELRSLPRGFTHLKAEPYADALRLKSFIVVQQVEPESYQDAAVVKAAVKFAKDATPLLQWGRKALEQYGPKEELISKSVAL